MIDLQVRLDKIRQRITSQAFLQSRGLGKDVPFYAFDYPASAERLVSDHLNWLLDDIARKTKLHIGSVNVLNWPLSN